MLMVTRYALEHEWWWSSGDALKCDDWCEMEVDIEPDDGHGCIAAKPSQIETRPFVLFSKKGGARRLGDDWCEMEVKIDPELHDDACAVAKPIQRSTTPCALFLKNSGACWLGSACKGSHDVSSDALKAWAQKSRKAKRNMVRRARQAADRGGEGQQSPERGPHCQPDTQGSGPRPHLLRPAASVERKSPRSASWEFRHLWAHVAY